MARRTGRQANENTNPTAEAPAEATTEEEAMTATAEAPVEEPTTTEADAEGTDNEQSPEQQAAKKEDKPIDLSAFANAIDSALAEADDTTGELPKVSVAAITETYRQLDGAKAKNAAKKLVNDRLSDAMNSGNLPGARCYFLISEQALVPSNAKSSSERVPSDPTEAFVQRVATLSLAYALATASVPEGVKDGWQETAQSMVGDNFAAAQEHLAWVTSNADDKGEEPEVPGFVKASVKLAQGKGTRGAGSGAPRTPFTGERRDVAKHIVEAFAGKEEGTFLKIGEIRAVGTSEYEASTASQGAISARLYPGGDGSKSTMLKFGIRPEVRDGKKGAVLVNADNSPVE